MIRKHKPILIELPEPIEFEWNEWNIKKNQTKHKVSVSEMEQIFSDLGKKIFSDMFHSKKENRYIAIGRTQTNRVLYAAFTIRNNKVRIISARDLNRKERNLYP